MLKTDANNLLRALFRRHGAPGPALGIVFGRHDRAVFSAWQELPDGERREIQLALQDVHALADGRGLKVAGGNPAPPAASGLGVRYATGRHDKALWAYLEFPDAFRQAALFARADALKGGRYWVKRNHLPRQRVAVNQGRVGGLEQAAPRPLLAHGNARQALQGRTL